MRKIGSRGAKARMVGFVKDCLVVLEAAEVLILRLLLFCTLVYHFVHSFLVAK
jgi:hypothetical protein